MKKSKATLYLDQVDYMMKKAVSGELGTPGKPDRSNPMRKAFWLGYFGHRTPEEYQIGPTRACVEAGQNYGHYLMSDASLI